MKCRAPYMMGTLECPCGGCLPCRISRRRIWAHRLMLESFKHGDSCFVTLTYDDDHVPDSRSLVKADYQLWLKRLRKLLPFKVRYFVAGEYGPKSGRPHYHAAVFGLSSLVAGGYDGRSGVVRATWLMGNIYVGELTMESASYIAGYVTKKHLSTYAEPAEGCINEFSRMSLRPGIGRAAVIDIARSVATDVGLDEIVRSLDVPSVLRHGKRLLPLGRYLRGKLRRDVGFSSEKAPSESSRMFSLLKAAEMVEARASLKGQGLKAWEAEKLILDMRNQYINNVESRFRVKDSQRSLK